MTYREIEKEIRRHYPKKSEIRPEVMKFTKDGLYVLGTEQQIDMFSVLMSRYSLTYYRQGTGVCDSFLDVCMMTYRRHG